MSDNYQTRTRTTPFIFKYSEKMESQPGSMIFRYNMDKQLSEAFLGGTWVDAATLEAKVEFAATRLTEIRKETTDDE
jgi:hypothetical protein